MTTQRPMARSELQLVLGVSAMLAGIMAVALGIPSNAVLTAVIAYGACYLAALASLCAVHLCRSTAPRSTLALAGPPLGYGLAMLVALAAAPPLHTMLAPRLVALAGPVAVFSVMALVASLLALTRLYHRAVSRAPQDDAL